MSSISSTLQIAKMVASEKLCSLREDVRRPMLQTANMAEDKNGGPNHLQAWREFRGLTQDELGAKIGTTGSVISLLEAGDRGLSAKWLRRLAPALETTPGHLLDHDPRRVSADIISLWSRMNLDQRGQIVDIGKTIIGEKR